MITPTADRIVVREIKTEDQTTKGGIVLTAEDKQSRHKEGVVVAVGRGRIADPSSTDVAGIAASHFAFYPMETNVGDIVVFSFGDEYTIDGEKLYILKENDVLAIKK